MTTIMVSGGFDPLHVGHLRMFQEAAEFGDLVVVLNSDGWLMRKKGFVFMPFKERATIIEELRCVAAVYPAIDNDDTVCESIEIIKPNVFVNGGDRKENNTPEKEICKELGITIKYNIGGEKTQSSSRLVRQERPWGYWQMLSQGDGYWIKKITVNPIEALSLQRHQHRGEEWIILKGSADVILGGKRRELNEGESICIPKTWVHRLINNRQEPLEVLEIAYGDILSESDIERLDDNYGREK